MSKIILQGTIEVPMSELTQVKAALESHIKLTRAEPGCLVFKVESAQDCPNRFHVYEEFIDQAAFEYHQNRVKQSDWGKVSQHAVRNYQILGLSETSK